mmetsp:Transcript_28026/g.66898  ORF Transcript_28026/g.66898 Transcript_28026/m.66898 type:complete len:280 (-) Transcript_28026:490-1329(-)
MARDPLHARHRPRLLPPRLPCHLGILTLAVLAVGRIPPLAPRQRRQQLPDHHRFLIIRNLNDALERAQRADARRTHGSPVRVRLGVHGRDPRPRAEQDPLTRRHPPAPHPVVGRGQRNRSERRPAYERHPQEPACAHVRADGRGGGGVWDFACRVRGTHLGLDARFGVRARKGVQRFEEPPLRRGSNGRSSVRPKLRHSVQNPAGATAPHDKLPVVLARGGGGLGGHRPLPRARDLAAGLRAIPGIASHRAERAVPARVPTGRGGAVGIPGRDNGRGDV